MNPFGTLSRTAEGGYVLHYERTLAQPAAKVWAAITDTGIAVNWIGDIEAELRVGGKFIIRFRNSTNVMTGKITALEHERLIAYDWEENDGMPQSLVRWTIAAHGPAACKLTLTHVLPAGGKAEDIISFGAGWHSFLDGAAVALLGGDGLKTAYDAEAWPPLEKAYTDMFKSAPVMAIDGTLMDGSEPLLRFERIVDQPVAKVWAALIDPKVLKNWLGDVAVEPRVGGTYRIGFREHNSTMSGTITAFVPERLLEYSWDEGPTIPRSLARWELSPAKGSCRLVLTQRFAKDTAKKDILPFFGGWEALLDALGRGASGAYVPYIGVAPYDAKYREKFG
ncbi:MAG TPA: SRPBCC family protein [Rhizomicrobium sp.]